MHNLSCENKFYLHWKMRNNFHIKGLAVNLVLIKRPWGIDAFCRTEPRSEIFLKNMLKKLIIYWSNDYHGYPAWLCICICSDIVKGDFNSLPAAGNHLCAASPKGIGCW